jgi:hypothetical protein
MASTYSPEYSNVVENRWAPRQSPGAAHHAVDLDRISRKPPVRRRMSRAIIRFLVTFGLGIAATLAWQSYGDTARDIVAASSPQLAWLAPQAAPLAATAPDTVAPATPAAPAPNLEQFNTMLRGLVAIGQRVEQIAAGQQQMADEITRLRADQRDIVQKISAPPQNAAPAQMAAPPPRPAAVPARKPAPPTSPLPLSQATPAR